MFSRAKVASCEGFDTADGVKNLISQCEELCTILTRKTWTESVNG